MRHACWGPLAMTLPHPRALASLPPFASQFYGFSATASRKGNSAVPRGIIHPNSTWYQAWWYTTVLVAAITAFLQPYYIAFAPPGL